MLAIPRAVQRVLFPVVVAVGRLLGRHRRFAGAPEPVHRPRPSDGVIGSRAAMRFFEYESRRILERERIPISRSGLRHRRPRRPAAIAEEVGGPGRDQVAGAHRRPHEGRRA